MAVYGVSTYGVGTYGTDPDEGALPTWQRFEAESDLNVRREAEDG